jgi:hypothetical protein
MSLLAPPKALYPNLDTAFAVIQPHAKDAGHAFVQMDKKASRVVFA